MAPSKDFREPVHQFLSVFDKQTEPVKDEATGSQSEAKSEPKTLKQVKPKKPKLFNIAHPKTAEADSAPIGYRLSPKFIEIKSKRLQLVLQPTLYRKVKRAAQIEKTSVNEYIHKLLERETQGV